ncbi:hypothetical protein CPB86DRAFT_623080 [Serendipita vermifera]|nr:hypothetical protein CPB86DRAFT_623080 [Serendipita vermifera]
MTIQHFHLSEHYLSNDSFSRRTDDIEIRTPYPIQFITILCVHRYNYGFFNLSRFLLLCLPEIHRTRLGFG